MAAGVDATSQNRVSLGGLFGGIFAETYSADDFVKSLEVGSVYRAGDETIAVALKDDLHLEDYRVIVFNGDNQYDMRDRPTIRPIARERKSVGQGKRGSVSVDLGGLHDIKQ